MMAFIADLTSVSLCYELMMGVAAKYTQRHYSILLSCSKDCPLGSNMMQLAEKNTRKLPEQTLRILRGSCNCYILFKCCSYVENECYNLLPRSSNSPNIKLPFLSVEKCTINHAGIFKMSLVFSLLAMMKSLMCKIRIPKCVPLI